MKKLNYFLKNRFNSALYLFALFPLIPNNIKGLLVAIIFFSSINPKLTKRNFKSFALIGSLFFMYAVSILYSEDYHFGYKKVETLFSCLLIPASFFLFENYEAKNFNQKLFSQIFINSTFSFIIILVINYLESDLGYYSNWFANKFRIVSEKIPLIGQSSTYAALYAMISILLNYRLVTNHKLKKPTLVFYTIILILQSSFLFLIQNRTIIIFFFLFFIYTVFRQKFSFKMKSLFLTTILLGFLILLTSNRRMNDLIKFENYFTENGHKNFSTNTRIQTLNCASDLASQALIFGHGVGDVQRLLDNCYTKIGINQSINSHNQYIDVLLKTGILGLFIFLFTIYHLLRRIISSGNEVLIWITIMFLLLFQTENLLSRQTGVMLFYFFISLAIKFEKRKYY